MHSPPGSTAQTLTRQPVLIWGGRTHGSRGDVLTLDFVFFKQSYLSKFKPASLTASQTSEFFVFALKCSNRLVSVPLLMNSTSFYIYFMSQKLYWHHLSGKNVIMVFQINSQILQPDTKVKFKISQIKAKLVLSAHFHKPKDVQSLSLKPHKFARGLLKLLMMLFKH